MSLAISTMRNFMRNQYSILLLYILCTHIVFVTSHEGHEIIQSGFKVADNGFQADWLISNGYINFTITAPTKGWVGIAFAQSSADGDDAIIGHAEGDIVSVTDRFIPKGEQSAKLDTDQNGTDDVIDVSVKYDDNGIKLKFSRKLDTGDKNADYIVTEGSFTMKWAYGDDITTVGLFAPNSTTGQVNADFFPEEEDEYEEMKKIKYHGFMMCLLVMVLMSSAIVTARFLKKIVAWWFYLHVVLTVLCLVSMITALSLVFAAHDNKFIPSWHSAFGIIFIILISVQALLGLYSHFAFDKYRREPPVFPDRIHWWLGRLVFGVGTLNLALGFGILGGYPASGWIFYVLWIITMAIIFTYLERNIGQTHETQTGHTVLESAMEEVDNKGGAKKLKQQRKSAEFLVMFFVPAVTAVIITFLGVTLSI